MPPFQGLVCCGRISRGAAPGYHLAPRWGGCFPPVFGGLFPHNLGGWFPGIVRACFPRVWDRIPSCALVRERWWKAISPHTRRRAFGWMPPFQGLVCCVRISRGAAPGYHLAPRWGGWFPHVFGGLFPQPSGGCFPPRWDGFPSRPLARAPWRKPPRHGIQHRRDAFTGPRRGRMRQPGATPREPTGKSSTSPERAEHP